MGAYIITQHDKDLLLQRSLRYMVRFEVFDDNGNIQEVLDGVLQGGSYSIDATSDCRRTVSISLTPVLLEHTITFLGEEGSIWLDKTIKMYIGIMDWRTGEYVFYPEGTYVYMSVGHTYDVQTNTLSLTLNDFTAVLDGTRNGQVGALTTVIPAYEENPTTGEVTKYNYIRDAMISLVTQLGKIPRYQIEDIGESKGLIDFNPNYLIYRAQHPTWNSVPYDLTFSAGDTLLSMINTLRDLYPNYETFFHPFDNSFVCQLIPSNEDDDLTLDNDYLQKIVISEDTQNDLSVVKNITEVWGEVIEAGWYTETCTYSNGTYSATIDQYDEYKSSDVVAVKIPATNAANPKLNINGKGDIPMYFGSSEAKGLTANYLEKNTVYVFKIKKTRANGTTTTCAYLQGHWQVHGMDVLSNGVLGGNVKCMDGTTQVKYSQAYFQHQYNCENVHMTILPDSPFVVQKIGEILDVKSGDIYEAISSDADAVERAIYDNWTTSRLPDTVTITTLLIPWLDVNVKVSYKPSDSNTVNQYIVSNVSHDFGSLTSSITMYRFYPLYNS